VSLDVGAVASQVRQMGQDIALADSDFRDRVRWARHLLQDNSQHYREIADNVKRSKEPRLGRAALPQEPLAARHAAPSCPTAYLVAAADGSQAEPDRQGYVSYYLINTGTAIIRYGAEAKASFSSTPRLFYRPQDMYVTQERDPSLPPDLEPEAVPVDADILAMKRSLAEIEELSHLAQTLPRDLPLLLLIDGTLTLFAKSTDRDRWVAEHFVKGYQRALEEIRHAHVPVAGFISRSSATWVMDMLQVGLCQRRVDVCAYCRQRASREREGCALADLRDRVLYDDTLNEEGVLPPLAPGERSALFQTSASLYREYGTNQPVLFYMNSGREIAKVQVPMWVADDRQLLDQVHAIVWQQCRNGDGYPTVLVRAHEQAVITAADRETLDNLVLAQMVRQHIRVRESAKRRSKQVRAV